MFRGEGFIDMKAFGKNHKEYLAKFFKFLDDVLDNDTSRRVFEKINCLELLLNLSFFLIFFSSLPLSLLKSKCRCRITIDFFYLTFCD